MEKASKEKSGYTYEVAVSFAGEQRNYVEKVVECLKSKGISYFYDGEQDSEIDMWGKNLIEHFHSVFSKKSRFCVMFISSNYAEKQWTRFERRVALERAMKQDEEYVLPVRFDDTELPGLLGTTKYLDLRQISPTELADRIESKLKSLLKRSPAIRGVEQNTNSLTEEWLGEVSAILIPLTAYITEVEDRVNNPGLQQICSAFEMACDDLREHLKTPRETVSHRDLVKFTGLAESIATYDFYLGRECWQGFKGLLTEANSMIRKILSRPEFQSVVEVEIIEELNSILSGVIIELDTATQDIFALGPLQVHKRLPHYQQLISGLGFRLYKLSWIFEQNGSQGIAKTIRQEALALHSIEVVDCFTHAREILDFTKSLPERLSVLRDIEGGDWSK
jgi:hypothetical protein